MSLDQDQSFPDMSHTSTEDNQGKRRGDSSDSENSDNAMDDKSDSLQDDFSSLESQSHLVANSPSAACEDTVRQSDDVLSKSSEEESNAQKASQDETIGTAPADTPAQHSASEDAKSTSQPGLGKESKSNEPENKKGDMKKSKNEKDTVTATQATLDQNANMEPSKKQTGQTNQKGKRQQDQKQKVSKEWVIFSPQPSTKVIVSK